MAQTSYSNSPAVGRAGDLYGAGPRIIDGAICDGAVQVGLLGQFADTQDTASELHPGEFQPLAALAVDADAIITTLASSASAATLSGASLNGAVGATEMVPARRITLTLDSHANWDAGTWVLKGRDCEGKEISEIFVVADAGNATYTSHLFYSRVTSLYAPAQSGTGGNMTVGITADEGEFSSANFGIAVRNPASEPLTSADLFTDGDPCDVMREGEICAVSEAATVKGDPVFVRCATSGADLRGQFTNAPTASFGLLRGAYWSRGCAQDAVGVIKIK